MPTKSKKPSQPNKLAKFKRQAINFIASKNLKITKNIKILIGVVLSLAIIVVIVVLAQIDKNKTEYATTIVKRDTLIQTVSETGVIQTSGRIDLNFLNTGRIDMILVKVGDKVKKGQILAKIDYKNLLIKEKEAKANLAAQTAGLNQLLEGAAKEEIAVSQSSVDQAQASYNASEIELAQTKITTQENISQAKSALNNLKEKNQDNTTAFEQAVSAAKVNLKNTQETYDKTITNYEDTSIAIIESDLAIMNTAIDNINTVLKNDDIKDTFSVKDTSYLKNTNNYYGLASELKIKAYESLGKAKVSHSYEEINKALNKTKQAIKAVFDALNNCYNALENTVISSTFSQTQLDSFKVTISSQLTLISAAKLEIQSVAQNLNNSILNYKTQVEAAEQNLSQVESNLDDAFLNAQNNLSTIQLSSQKQIALINTKLNSAKESLNVAKARLDLTKAPARATDIAFRQAQIEQASATLESIRNNIEGSVIKAPQDGTIIKVNYDIGEQNLSAPAISMLLDDMLKIEVDISETDIIKIEEGDVVDITLDAFGEDSKFSGNVYFIEPAETLIQDVVYYKVTINFDLNSPLIKKIKPGMSANTTIITDKKENILIVPYRAIVSRNGGSEFVRILSDDNIMSEIPLKTGMRGDGGNIEALEGVSEGDVVVTYIKGL